MKKILTSNGKALVDSTGNILTFESDVTITSGDEAIGLSGEYDGSPIEVTEAGKVDIRALIDEKKIPFEVNVNIEGTLDITENGTHDVTNYANANVNVPIPQGYLKPSGTLDITSNGNHSVDSYANVEVNVPVPSEYIIPTGTLDITENGEHNVREYEKVNVNVASSGGGSSEEYPSESIAYYKANRNKNYPYLPLPYEMENEEQDTIYMLYGASGYMCCPVFKIKFTNCVCTIQKYMNTTLVSEYVENVTSETTKYLQFSEEDSDYSTYNYIVIKLQGNITKHYLNYKPKFNGVEYNSSVSSGELIEVSGKCVGCDIKVVNSNTYKYYQNLEYYSFLGVSTTYMTNMFYYCSSLQIIPQLDTSKVTDMNSMFNYCISLQTIPQLDTSNVTDISSMFRNCYTLQTIPQLDTSNVTNMSYMFSSCYSLQTIPLLDTSNVTNMRYMFNYCYTLQTIPQLDTSNVPDMRYMFYYCHSLQAIPQLDTSNVTNMDSMFYYCYILYKLDIINMKSSFKLDNSTMLTQSELVKILNNLATVETTQTLTLGSKLLAKLTEEQKAIATAKGWTLA